MHYHQPLSIFSNRYSNVSYSAYSALVLLAKQPAIMRHEILTSTWKLMVSYPHRDAHVSSTGLPSALTPDQHTWIHVDSQLNPWVVGRFTTGNMRERERERERDRERERERQREIMYICIYTPTHSIVPCLHAAVHVSDPRPSSTLRCQGAEGLALF